MSAIAIPSHRFEEHSMHYTGTRTRQPITPSNVTAAREQAMQDIYDLASSKNIPIDLVITQILGNSQGELMAYVQSMGETPLTDPTALALQAVLLRAGQVGTVATTLDISDEDALQVLENNYQEAIDTNSPEVSNEPSIPAQAAIACALAYLSDQAASANLPNTMSGITSSIAGAASKYRKAKASSSANNDDSTFTLDQLADPSPTTLNDPNQDAAVNMTMAPASVSSQLAAIPGGSQSITSLDTSIAPPTIAASASNLPQAGASGTTTSGGVLNAISSTLASISNIATQVTATSGTISKAISGAGANSIQTYVQNNQGTIMVIVVIILIIIVAAIYGSRK